MCLQLRIKNEFMYFSTLGKFSQSKSKLLVELNYSSSSKFGQWKKSMCGNWREFDTDWMKKGIFRPWSHTHTVSL